MIALQKPQNLIPLKKPEMQGAKFSRNEAYLAYAAVTGKLKQRRRSGFFSGITDENVERPKGSSAMTVEIASQGASMQRTRPTVQKTGLIHGRWHTPLLCLPIPGLLALAFLGGCMSAAESVRHADAVAQAIIAGKQQEAIGRTESFSVERPEETLRRRILLGQNLPVSSRASLGSRFLEPIRNWPAGVGAAPQSAPGGPETGSLECCVLRLTLTEALQAAARNSRDYQAAKEEVFSAALALDLERDAFRSTFAGALQGLFSSDYGGDDTVSGIESSAAAGMTRRLKIGASVTADIALDLVTLLTGGGASSLGLLGDATISIPLLRGAGRHVVTEPLTQAEREVLYAVWNFERFKQIFAVQVVSEYLGVLAQFDQVENAWENYRRLTTSTRRAFRLAEAGRLPRFQVDQARQDELRARNRWVSARSAYERFLDSFKILLGLPPDARVDLDGGELERLSRLYSGILRPGGQGEKDGSAQARTPAEAEDPVEISAKAFSRSLESSPWVEEALERRLDLRIVQGRVRDAQRQVVVAADALRAGLTLEATGTAGERRAVASADLDNARFRPEKGFYTAALLFDPPWERTAERNALRESLLILEAAVRSLEAFEDGIKLEVRNRLRDLEEQREGVMIQTEALELARRRVQSTNLFLEAGRAEIRDVLDAQEALVSAQNALTAALVNYRVAELGLRRDTGRLEVDEKGLLREFLFEVAP